ncbi:hypothetical protein NL676_018052 [Syzygium grande]|nr:hypothetical protein NL676_018052 [Syzygium grande]
MVLLVAEFSTNLTWAEQFVCLGLFSPGGGSEEGEPAMGNPIGLCPVHALSEVGSCWKATSARRREKSPQSMDPSSERKGCRARDRGPSKRMIYTTLVRF